MREAMGLHQTSNRETDLGPPHITTDRYLASDFHRLTNPVSRRFTTPATTPDSSFAHEPHAEPKNKAAEAKPRVPQFDKRAPSNSSPSPNNSPLISPAGVKSSAHGHGHATASRQSSTSRGTRQFGPGPVDTCVKEDNSGQFVAYGILSLRNIFVLYITHCSYSNSSDPSVAYTLPTHYLN